jgi:IclR family acetate operon transcriptional repressor
MLVKQISNLFRLMDFYVRAKRPLSVREIVEEMSWPRSSAFNIVSTLVEEGYLYQPVPRGGYVPTSRWLELARELSESQPLPELAHDLLVELCRETGETLFLAAPEGTSVVFLDVVESSADIRFIANVGQRLPIHVTAAGRAILSQYSPDERAAILKRIKYQPYEKDTFMTPESVERDVQRGAGEGWYINMGIYAPGVAGIAVPLPLADRRYAIALGGPASRIGENATAIGKLLRERVSRFLREQAFSAHQ